MKKAKVITLSERELRMGDKLYDARQCIKSLESDLAQARVHLVNIRAERDRFKRAFMLSRTCPHCEDVMPSGLSCGCGYIPRDNSIVAIMHGSPAEAAGEEG